MLSWNDVLTLTWLAAPKLNLLLLVCVLVRVVAEKLVHPPLVCAIGNDDQDWEEHKCDDSLPDLNPVFGNENEDHQEPDVGEDREQGGDAEHRELLDPKNNDMIIRMKKKYIIY